ncbi:hypothetical protein O3G_MSEX000367 [Manduca sexta]|nr:hypothetical protein O3G_MSEX000367 [Manduca sexta]
MLITSSRVDHHGSRKLLIVLDSAKLHVLPLQATHHYMDGHDTWLDIILSSAPSPVFSHGQFPAPGFTHHDLIYISYALKPPKFPSKILHLRSFGRIDADKLKGDAANFNWDHLLAATSVDDKVAIFNRCHCTL